MTNVTLFDTVVIQKMTEEEATACLRRIKSHLSDARNEILALYEREGWLTLGYTSWGEYAGFKPQVAQSFCFISILIVISKQLFKGGVEPTAT